MLPLALAPALVMAANLSPLAPAVSPCAVDRDAAFARYVAPELHVNRSPIGQVDRAPAKARPPEAEAPAKSKAAPVCIQQVSQPLAAQDAARPRS